MPAQRSGFLAPDKTIVASIYSIPSTKLISSCKQTIWILWRKEVRVKDSKTQESQCRALKNYHNKDQPDKPRLTFSTVLDIIGSDEEARTSWSLAKMSLKSKNVLSQTVLNKLVSTQAAQLGNYFLNRKNTTGAHPQGTCLRTHYWGKKEQKSQAPG